MEKDMRIRRQVTTTIVAVLIGLFLCASARAQQAGVLDQVPGDALVVVRVKNLSETNKKLAKYMKELGLDQMQPELADPLGALQQQGHLQKGLNTNGDLAFAFLNPEAFGGDPEKSMVFVFPVTDFKAFVGNFKDPKEEGGVTKASPPDGGEDVYLAQWGNFAAVSPAKEVLAKKPTGVKLQGAIAKEADANDLIVYANMNSIRPLVLPHIKDGRQMLMAQVDDAMNNIGDAGKKFAPVVRALVNQIANVTEGFLNDSTGVTLGFSLGDAGVTSTLLADFKPDSYAGKLVAQQKNTNQPLTTGLPDRTYFAFGGTVQDPQVATRVFSDFLDPITKELANIPEGKSINTAVEAFKKTIGATTGNSMGWVAPSAPGQESLFQQIVVMHGDAAAIQAGERQMMQSMADLMKMVPQQQGMSSSFEMKQGAKNVAGVSLDAYEQKFNLDDKNPQAAQLKQIMSMIYGPNGQSGVMGQVGPKTFIVVQGGTDQLISDAIGAAKGNAAPGGAAAQSVKSVASHLPQNRTAEFYVEVDNIVNTGLKFAKANGFAPGNLKLQGDLPPIGAACASEQNAVRVDGFIPLDLVKGLVAFGIEAQKQMGKPGGGL